MNLKRAVPFAISLLALTAWNQTPKPGFGDKGCSGKVSMAQHISVRQNDFLELHQLQSYARSPVYTVRIYGDGRVIWHGNTAVSFFGEASQTSDPAQTKALIARAHDLGFESLCEEYVLRGFDGGISVTTLSLGGQTKTVSVTGLSDAPPWLLQLQKEIAALPQVQSLIGSGQ